MNSYEFAVSPTEHLRADSARTPGFLLLPGASVIRTNRRRWGRLPAILAISMATCMAWMALGFYVANKTSASLRARNYQQTSWGPGQEQHPPTASSEHARRIPLERTRANAHLEFDNQQAGLVNYSRYRVRFEGVYRFTNPVDHQQEVVIVFPLPSLANHYDDMEFLVNGAPKHLQHCPRLLRSAMRPQRMRLWNSVQTTNPEGAIDGPTHSFKSSTDRRSGMPRTSRFM